MGTVKWMQVEVKIVNIDLEKIKDRRIRVDTEIASEKYGILRRNTSLNVNTIPPPSSK